MRSISHAPRPGGSISRATRPTVACARGATVTRLTLTTSPCAETCEDAASPIVKDTTTAALAMRPSPAALSLFILPPSACYCASGRDSHYCLHWPKSGLQVDHKRLLLSTSTVSPPAPPPSPLRATPPPAVRAFSNRRRTRKHSRRNSKNVDGSLTYQGA